MENRSLHDEILNLVDSNTPFTDILIEEGMPIVIDSPKGWVALDDFDYAPATREDMLPILTGIDPNWEKNISEHGISRPYELSKWRLRVSAIRASGGTKVTLSVRRQLKNPIPLKQTGLPLNISTLADASRGLILVAGPTGSGKTTTMASLLDHINNTRNAHIVTIEDPLEFLHERKNSVFTQREVGTDVSSFREGVKDAMRQKPNVIMIGEIRDAETADIALLAADSGHLVLASVHANDGSSTISKMLSWFPEQELKHRSLTLANALVGVIYQSILPKADGTGYVLAAETLFNQNRQLATFISDPEKRAGLDAYISRREDKASRSIADHLAELVRNNLVSEEAAMKSVQTHVRADLHQKLTAGAKR